VNEPYGTHQNIAIFVKQHFVQIKHLYIFFRALSWSKIENNHEKMQHTRKRRNQKSAENIFWRCFLETSSVAEFHSKVCRCFTKHIIESTFIHP
jgi:hypothetical protein